MWAYCQPVLRKASETFSQPRHVGPHLLKGLSQDSLTNSEL